MDEYYKTDNKHYFIEIENGNIFKYYDKYFQYKLNIERIDDNITVKFRFLTNKKEYCIYFEEVKTYLELHTARTVDRNPYIFIKETNDYIHIHEDEKHEIDWDKSKSEYQQQLLETEHPKLYGYAFEVICNKYIDKVCKPILLLSLTNNYNKQQIIKEMISLGFKKNIKNNNIITIFSNNTNKPILAFYDIDIFDYKKFNRCVVKCLKEVEHFIYRRKIY